jgi:hypothetical protein
MNNAAVESLLEKEKRLGDKLKFEDIIDEVAGVYPRIMMEGDMDAGAWSCGMVAGLINDIPNAALDNLFPLRRHVHARADRIRNAYRVVPR